MPGHTTGQVLTCTRQAEGQIQAQGKQVCSCWPQWHMGTTYKEHRALLVIFHNQACRLFLLHSRVHFANVSFPVPRQFRAGLGVLPPPSTRYAKMNLKTIRVQRFRKDTD